MVQAIDSRDYPVAAAAPLLLALGLAPLVAGFQDVLPILSLALLVWISLLLRLGLPARASRTNLGPAWVAAALPLFGVVSCFCSANLGATVTQALLLASYLVALWLVADLVRNGRAAWVLGGVLIGALLAGGLA